MLRATLTSACLPTPGIGSKFRFIKWIKKAYQLRWGQNLAKYDIRAPFNRAHPQKKKKNATLDKGMDYFDWKNVVDMWYKEVDIFDEHNVL